MKKITWILLAVMLVLNLAACGSDAGNGKDGKDVTASPEEIEQEIAAAVGKDNYLCNTDIEKDWLQNSFGLDLSRVEEYVAKENAISSVNPDTVVILKVKDGYAGEAVEQLNGVFGRAVSYIRQYPFGTAKVLNARLYQSGNYVMYIIAGASYDGEDTEEENKLAVSEYARIDEAIKSIFGASLKNLAEIPEDDGNGGLLIPEDENDMPVLGG